MALFDKLFKHRIGNSIQDVKVRLLTTFSFIALSTSFIVFFSFALSLVLHEDDQIQQHLVSFEQIGVKHYSLSQEDTTELSKHVMAYYSHDALPANLRENGPYPLGEVTRIRSYYLEGFMVYRTEFEYQGKTVPMYLTIGARAIEFGDDNWDVLLGVSMLLMVFLIVVLRFSLKRVFEGLMSPISELSQQLQTKQEGQFKVNERAIDEIQQMTQHLNQYAQMKERLGKQELMFAKYASHELKTPIAVVLGAAELQAMKPDEAFQTKQRKRILTAAQGMQNTMEVLLSIVKQENVSQVNQEYPVAHFQLDVESYRGSNHSNVPIDVVIEEGAHVNFPRVVLEMILKNLVSNALRFTEHGKIEVIIGSQGVTVLDTGTGYNPENGTEHGLGLLIVQRLCASYGWQFKIGDNPNQQGCLAQLSR